MKNKKTVKYNTLVTLWISIIVLVLTGFLSVVISNYAFKAIRSEIQRSLDSTAKHMADKMDEFMWSRTSELMTIASLTPMKSLDNLEEVEAIISTLKKQFPTYSWIGVLNINGDVIAATDDLLKGKNVSALPVFQNGIQGLFIGDVNDSVLMSDALFNPTKEPMKFVDISFPLNDASGKVVGVIAAHFCWDWAKAVQISILEPLQSSEDIEMFVVSAIDQSVLLGPTDRIGTQYVFNRPGFIEASAVADGYLDYPGLGWTIHVRQPEAVAFKQVNALQLLVWGVSVFIAGIFILIGFVMSKRISKPLSDISAAINRHQYGEPISLPQAKGVYEIQHLTQTLYDLFETLHINNKTINNLENAVSTDSLTSLSNRVGLKNYWQMVTTHHHALYLLSLDLDGFKDINDTYGHAAGDHVLRVVANRLKSAIREHELAARMGGDEFVVVLYANQFQTDTSTSFTDYKVATRIISEINKPIIYEAFSLQVGCSIGGTLWHSPDTLSKALAISDDALYQAKANGKNQYVFFEMPSRGEHD